MIMTIMQYGLEYFGMYYGLYKGTVINNDDPLNRGRVIVHCPQVHGPTTSVIWAEPKAAMAGANFGLWHIPDVGEWVWVAFDHGRPEFPIWDGGWWANGEPTTDMVKSKVVLATKEGMKIVIDRLAKTILVQQSVGNSVTVSQDEIDIQSVVKLSIVAPLTLIQGNVEIEGSLSATGNVAITGNIAMTGDGAVSGTWTALHNSGHHTHPIGPDPLAPLNTIALPSVP